MHYGGYPCHMEEIMSIADHHGLSVIEDAAHAPGAALGNKMIGAIGDVGCFSFFSNKNLSTGEGGMLVTDRKDVADKVRLQRSHGMTTLTYDRHKGHAHSYDVIDLGYNYRIDEIRSALGLTQLKKLAVNNALRASCTHQYRDALSGKGLELPFSASFGQPAYHLFPILLPPGVNREQFFEYMRAERIQTSIHYPPIHTFSYYQHRFGSISLPRTEQAGLREVTLPLYPTMTREKVALIVDAVVNGLAR
jgi:dTDP-4-amino-4,6-dideoxygalactose transaminase